MSVSRMIHIVNLNLNAMKTTTQFILVVLVGLCSCEEDAGNPGSSNVEARLKTPEDSLFHQVMEGHDAGMAKIGRLKKYSSQLQAAIDSINKTSSAEKSEIPGLKRVKDSLDAANASMFTWMDGFKADTLTGMVTERMEYLEMQKASVTIVRDRIFNSLRLYDSLDRK